MDTPNGLLGFGQPATEEQIAGWNIDVADDMTGRVPVFRILPLLAPGAGTPAPE